MNHSELESDNVLEMLKAARHQPPSPGTAIARVRMLSTPATEAEQADDAGRCWPTAR